MSDHADNVQPDENQIIAERRVKLDALRATGPAFPNDFARSNLAAELHAAHDAKSNEQLEAGPVEVAIAGRMMLKRVMGKASFARRSAMIWFSSGWTLSA